MKSKPNDTSVFANLKAEKERMEAENKIEIKKETKALDKKESVKKEIKAKPADKKPVKKEEVKKPVEKAPVQEKKDADQEEKAGRLSIVVRITQKNSYFLKIMSVRKGLSQSDYIAELIQMEQEIIDDGKAPKPFEVQEKIPSKKGSVQKMFQLYEDTLNTFVEQSQHYGLNRSEYTNFILQNDIERNPGVVE